jgi:hypothetical protein
MNIIDPLAAFLDGAVEPRSRRPLPHVSTRLAVAIAAPLASVSITRVFRNDEDRPIEAVITLPVPVHATVYGLQAVIDGRVLNGVAKARQTARADYEDAIDRGRAAVLHEETLRGIHTLSVAHVPPGAAIEVRFDYVLALTRAGDALTLRIPTTVGQIYGRSPSSEVDALVTGGPPQRARLEIASTAPVRDRAGQPVAALSQAPLDRPIDLAVALDALAPLRAETAGGRAFGLDARPLDAAARPLRLAVLVDRSGSMGSTADLDRGLSKHRAAAQGLAIAASALTDADVVQLWEFDGDANLVFDGAGSALAGACQRLRGPSGGTRIGHALARVLAQAGIDEVLVITDGQSYDINVQALARGERRISAVLVGEDSLEANIGHLAALTDGELFVSGAAPLQQLVAEAVADLRARPAVSGEPGRILRGGLEFLTVAAPDAVEAPVLPFRTAGAFAAAATLSHLPEPEAAALAQAEGLVTHLTSLVLVDEVGAAQEGLPEMRKIALPTPAVAVAAAPRAAGAGRSRAPQDFVVGAPAPPPAAEAPVSAGRPTRSRGFSLSKLGWPAARSAAPSAPAAAGGAPADAIGDTSAIDWGRNGRTLAKGDVSGLPPQQAAALQARAGASAMQMLAAARGLSPLLIVIALAAARAALTGDRAAARVARAILGTDKAQDLRALLASM